MEKVFVDKKIPHFIIKSFVNDGYDVHLLAGSGLFSRTKPVFDLARKSNVNYYNIHWGELTRIVKEHKPYMFLTSDMKYKDLDGFIHWDQTETFSVEDLKFGAIEEKWNTTNGDESCPICLTLQGLDWVAKDQPVAYDWPGGSKEIFGLPAYRKAHSVIGEGEWKVGDDKCKCYKSFRYNKNLTLSAVKRVVKLPICSCSS